GGDVVADSVSDTLNLVGTQGVTVTGDAGTDTLTFKSLAFPSTALNVCPSGCQYTTHCGADCSDPVSTCAAGSALAVRASMSSDPVEIRTGPGDYRECLRVTKEHNNTTFVGSGQDISTIHHPAIDLTLCNSGNNCGSAVDGGTWSVAGLDDPNGITANIGITGYTIRSDTWSPWSEGALMLGPRAINSSGGTVPDFSNIRIWNNKIVGHRAGIAIRDFTLTPVKENLPNVYLWDNLIVSGGEGVALKGVDRVWSRDNLIRVQTNYVETPDPDGFLGAVTGRVRTGEVSGFGEVLLDPNDVPTGVLEVDSFYTGRRVTLSDNADPNTTCDSQCVGNNYWAYQHIASNNSLNLFS
ncbi:hypothetical protein LCGC14_3060850, partial [marine sediment metagenome]